MFEMCIRDSASRQREVLVEQLEGVGQRQEGADRHAGHDHGNLDLKEDLAGGSACLLYTSRCV